MIKYVCAGVFFSVFLWEYLAEVEILELRPTFFIGNCSVPFEKLWTGFWSFMADLGSYLYHMQLKKIAYTLFLLVSSILNFLLIPVRTIPAYFERVYTSYGDHPYVIYVGSALLLVIIGAILHYYREKLPLKRIQAFFQTHWRWLPPLLAISALFIVTYYFEHVYPIVLKLIANATNSSK